MNKKTLLMFVIGVAITLLTAACYAQDDVVKLREMTGKVMVKISPSTTWAEAARDQAIKKSDFVKTGAGSKAVLEFPNKNTVTLKPNTEISVEELVWNDTAKKVGINMTSGELKTMINKINTPSEFKVRTPTAICGAKGTIFYVVVFANGTGLYVEQGLVEFLNTISGQSYTVYEGMNSNSNSDGSVTAPHELTKEEVNKIVTDYDMKPVAEPYTEPAGGKKSDTNPPQVIQENPASGS